MLARIKERTGLFDQAQMGPVLSLAFHPNKLMLAAGSLDYRVSIFSSPTAGDEKEASDSLSSSIHYR